jgi:hypothetical protein
MEEGKKILEAHFYNIRLKKEESKKRGGRGRKKPQPFLEKKRGGTFTNTSQDKG